MKLLIVTQAIDTENPFVGFFTEWVAKFATRVEQIEVICLKEGKHALPANVRVHSLGKEKGYSRGRYVLNFWSLIWRLRAEYDTVFVHMNPEYILLGSPLWRLLGKKITLWYNHPYRGLRLALAARLAKRLFYTSPYAASASFTKAKQMPVGIDVSMFSPHAVPRDRSAIYLQGRVAPSKHIDLALSALRIVREEVSTSTLTIVGPEDPLYAKQLRATYADLIDARAATLCGPLPLRETPPLYSAHGLALNLAAPGHFDKTVLEALACETPVIASSPVVVEAWRVVPNDPHALAAAIVRLITLPGQEYATLQHEGRDSVVATHSLEALADHLIKELHAVP